MIRISCEREHLEGWEKIRHARAISLIIRGLREFHKVIKEEKAIEVNYLIIMK